MTKACRSELHALSFSQASHAGLLFTRYLKSHKPTDSGERNQLPETPEESVLESATKIAASETYRNAFIRWRGLITERGGSSMTAQLGSSLAIGLGNESPLEVGLTVHHTYGMPVIPGSAIKGMCRRGALKLKAEGKMNDERLHVLFGDTKARSAFVFWDAWYDPTSVDGAPFHRDVITVHHPKYYQKGSAWPTDFDDPNPVPFLVVKPGAKFLFAISAPNEEWGKFALDLLKWCLQNIGIGGKTNAGYGYFNNPGPGGGSNPPSSEPPVFAGRISRGTVVPAQVLSSESGKVRVRLHIAAPVEMAFTYQAGIRPGKWVEVEIKDINKQGEPSAVSFKKLVG